LEKDTADMATFPPFNSHGQLDFTCKTYPPTAMDPGTTCATNTHKAKLTLKCSRPEKGACSESTTYRYGSVDGANITFVGSFHYYPGVLTPGDGINTPDSSFLSNVAGGTNPAAIACTCTPT
jgi:hypothetical protein